MLAPAGLRERHSSRQVLERIARMSRRALTGQSAPVTMRAVAGRRSRKGGRTGFDGIAIAAERHAGFRAPVKRSDNQNCQRFAVCTRCLVSRQPPQPTGSHIGRRCHLARWASRLLLGVSGPRLIGLDRGRLVRSQAAVETLERTKHVGSLRRSLSDAGSIPAASTNPLRIVRLSYPALTARRLGSGPCRVPYGIRHARVRGLQAIPFLRPSREVRPGGLPRQMRRAPTANPATLPGTASWCRSATT